MGSRGLAVSGAAGLGWIVPFRILWLRDLHCSPAQGDPFLLSDVCPAVWKLSCAALLAPFCLSQFYSLRNLPVWARHPHLSSEKTHLTEGFYRLCQGLVLWSIPDPLISQLEKIKWGSQPEICFEVGRNPLNHEFHYLENLIHLKIATAHSSYNHFLVFASVYRHLNLKWVWMDRNATVASKRLYLNYATGNIYAFWGGNTNTGDD